MYAGTTYQWNIRARVLEEDGSINCQSAWSAPSQFTILSSKLRESICFNRRHTFGADAPSTGDVWQASKLREVGTNSTVMYLVIQMVI